MVRDVARRYPTYSHVGWIDFGCVRTEKRKKIVPRDIDFDKLPLKRVLYQCLQRPESTHYPPHEMLSHDEIYFAGSMWVTPLALAERYAAVYEDALQRWHALKISDDDQSLVYQLFNAHPDMFTALDDPDWFRLYCGCLRKEKKKLNFMQQLSSFKKKRGRDEGK